MFGAAGHGEGDGNEQDEADFKKGGQADHEADHHHGPVNVFLAEDANERVGDLVCAAGLRHHFAEHGAKRDNDGDVSERGADARFEGMDDLGKRHAGDDREAN